MQLVDVSDYGFLVEPRYYFYGWTDERRVLGRESAVTALRAAESRLGRGMRFKVWDMQRPLAVQLRMIESFKRRIRLAHPDWDEEEVEKTTTTFAALPKPDSEVTRPDCHRNGGAVDLTIIHPSGVELYMGTDHDDLSERAATRYFHDLPKRSALDDIALHNRERLVTAMEKEGWKNLPNEWWHFSTIL